MPTSTIVAPRSDYGVLSSRLRDGGLMEARQGSYALRMAVTLAAYAAGWTALWVLGDSWASLGVAVFLAFMFTQADFIGHDAGHQQIFKSRRANRLVGLAAGNLLTGLSIGWWVPKHNAHHAHPNVVGQDPDIGAGVVALSFTPAIARSRRGAARLMARYQAWLFFPLLLVEGLGLHISGVDSLVRRRDRSAAVEGVLLATHAALYLTAVFWILSPLHALAFLAVQQGLFGLYLGCSFAPNHKGMPVLDDDSELGFVKRQVITARNVSGGRLTAFVFGGLNYQIEHHLFPAMPRRNLGRAQNIVRAFCMERDLPYHEAGILMSYRQALSYLNQVGKAVADPVRA